MIVDELVRCGVRHVVLCPGSRNAPLSMALHDAAVAGEVALHVRIDERSAGFLALGIGKAGAGPAAVCCTSGTAVANLHPAVLEAHHSATPLVVLSADRPAELVGTGANQTIDQRGLFGPAAPCVDMPLAERLPGAVAQWRSTVCRAMTLDGPVQLNVPFREPLVPSGDEEWPSSLAGRPGGGPWTTRAAERVETAVATGLAARTLVLAGDPGGRRPVGADWGWPVVAEPTAGQPGALPNGSLLINAGPLPAALRPDDVVVVGRPTLTRGVGAVLRSARRVVVVGGWVDPQHVAAEIVGGIDGAATDSAWAAAWRAADTAAGEVVDRSLAAEPWPTAALVARDLVRALPAGAPLFVGSSNPVRLVDLYGRSGDRHLAANRGVAGIDGSVSTAAGIALATGGPCYAFLGDLTFLHDTNGLLIGPAEQRPNLTVVVLNDDGGGIFGLLEQGAPEYRASFERVFGTPHGTGLAALCAAHGVPHTVVTDRDKLAAALHPEAGLRVVEIQVRRPSREWQAALFADVRDAVAAGH